MAQKDSDQIGHPVFNTGDEKGMAARCAQVGIPIC